MDGDFVAEKEIGCTYDDENRAFGLILGKMGIDLRRPAVQVRSPTGYARNELALRERDALHLREQNSIRIIVDWAPSIGNVQLLGVISVEGIHSRAMPCDESRSLLDKSKTVHLITGHGALMYTLVPKPYSAACLPRQSQ